MKQFVTFKMNFDSGMPHDIKVSANREQAAEYIEKMVNEEINTEIADYGDIDEEWKEDLCSQVNRLKFGMSNIVNDMVNNEAYYLIVAEN